MRVGLGQFNAVVGELGGNVEKMRRIYTSALRCDIDLLVFGELSVCGYPPEDLLHKKYFLDDCFSAAEKLAADCPDKTIILGLPVREDDNNYNCAAVLSGGKIKEIYRKRFLPNFSIFDEQRYFVAGTKPVVIEVGGVKIAITICADIWEVNRLAEFLSGLGQIQMVLNIAASGFCLGKISKRQAVVSECARKFNSAVCYCNLVGGQDEVVFDGRSMFCDSQGRIVSCGGAFEEDLLIADVLVVDDKEIRVEPVGERKSKVLEPIEEIYHALVLGTSDYVHKNGFQKVLLGLSGGIDSSVVAAIAFEALGVENVLGVTMPSQFSSIETIRDAKKLAKNLGIDFLTIPIEPILEQFDKSLGVLAGWNRETTAYENLQARIRGNILMSLSNQFGCLVLTTGNKSETAVGYATLYGDTAGGFSVIKDVPKTLVYKLAEHIKSIMNREVIPADVINRAPSAELREGQKDSDTLPDYDLLDEILKGYVEEDKSARELIESGLPKEEVCRVIRMVDRNEYKRRLSPPGIKITPKSFGKDRRLPITNRYSSWNDSDIQ